MSSDGHNEHVPGSTEPRELSHPVLWTVGLLVAVGVLAYVFFHFKQVGREHARGEPVWALPIAAAGPDHAALIADKSEAVIDRGQVLYGKNCASCHGANGDSNPGNTNPAPRNFHAERFKSKNGSGPYGFYISLTDGYGAAMPAFRNLSPEDRYAVAHFVREAWMKPNAEKTGYQAKDADAVAKTIPASGAAAGGAEAEINPAAIKPPATTWPLMAADAKASEAQQARLVRWLGDAAADCGPELLPAFHRIRAIAPTQMARLDHLFVAAQTQDRAAFNAILVAEDGAGSADPYFSLLGEDTLRKLYARLAETATRTN
jgi:mono/diheme cytochrome c family protein